MNNPPAGFDADGSPYRPVDAVDVVVFPTYLDIDRCLRAGLDVGAQSGHPTASGAFTGDVSMVQLASAGCAFVLCGHSERRKYHAETDAQVAAQAAAALDAGMQPIVCVGETAEERTAGREEEVVARQLKELPAGVSIIAYEPVWAIGTGNTATAEQAQAMHAFIRKTFANADLRILYGGSLNAANAESLLSQPDIDGGLIGGASLKPDDFARIVAIASSLRR